MLGTERHPAVIHAGQRPVFKDTPSLEIHLLDEPPSVVPNSVDIELVAYIREILDFPSVEALQEQIADDIAVARATLLPHVSDSQKARS